MKENFFKILNTHLFLQEKVLPEIICNKKDLDLSHYHISVEQLEILAQALLQANCLQTLHLTWCRLDKQHLHALAKIIQLPTLRILNLVCNHLNDGDLEILLPFFKKSNISKLYLRGNNFTSTINISKILRNSKIKHLSFSSNENIDSFRSLCEALPISHLEVLDLRFNWGKQLYDHLDNALQKSTQLQTLMLTVKTDKNMDFFDADKTFIRNFILERSPQCFASNWTKFAQNKRIRYLNFQQNDINNETFKNFSNILSPFSKLWGLDLRDNPINLSAISDFLEHTKASNIIYLSAGKRILFQLEKMESDRIEACLSISQSILKREIIHFSYISQIKSGWGWDPIEAALLVNQNKMVEMRMVLFNLIKDFIENKNIPSHLTEQIINETPFGQLPAFDSETAQLNVPFKPPIAQRLFEIYKARRAKQVQNEVVNTVDNKFKTMTI